LPITVADEVDEKKRLWRRERCSKIPVWFQIWILCIFSLVS